MLSEEGGNADLRESIPKCSEQTLGHGGEHILCQQGINNGSRTKWSPIRSEIIWVINKIRRPRSGSLICLITSMITDRIEWHEVLLPINQKLKNNWLKFFMNKN